MTTAHVRELMEIALGKLRRGAFDAALELLSAVTELDEDNAQAWFLLADIHRREHRFEAAIGCLRRAIALSPDRIDLHVALANVLTDDGRFQDAAGIFMRMSEAAPDDPDVIFSLGFALHRAGQSAEALRHLDRAVDLDPDNPVYRGTRGTVLLSMGRLEEGFRDFDTDGVRKSPVTPPDGAKRWDGAVAPSKRLLVLPEGGHGDVIWAARFLKTARDRVGALHLAVPSSLVALLSEVDGIDRLETEVDGDFDLYCSILSLPHLLGVTEASCHTPARLGSDAGAADGCTAPVNRTKEKLRVGIIWSGNPDYSENHHRAARLADFLPLAELPGVQLFSLQKGQPAAELAQARLGNLIVETSDFDFAETAAVIDALDVLVMTDTAAAHIAGSLGVPVWVLLDTCPHWYFGQSQNRSPWYPSMGLFRQNVPGDWRAVMAEVSEGLTDMARRNTHEN